MRLFRHFRALLADLFAFARQNKIWWIVPLVLLLLLVGLLIGGVSTISPFIYTLF